MMGHLACLKKALLGLLLLCVLGAVLLIRHLLTDDDDLPVLTPRRIVRVDQTPGKGGATGPPPSVPGEEAVACRVPQLQLDDPQLARFFHSVKPLPCAVEPNWVFVGAGNTFQIEPAAVLRHGRIDCTYEHFWRVDEWTVAKRRYVDYPSGSALLGDFFVANCTAADEHTFTNIYATVLPSDEAVRRARAVKPAADWSGLDVYHLGFDSMSRMHFQRKMPLTYKFVTEQLDAVVLKGYNIVGDGTPYAFIPILTGQTEQELPLVRMNYAEASFVDVYPMIWKDFERNGYVTMFGEDMAKWAVFAFRLKGFDKQPTDHYARTFYQVAEEDGRLADRRCLGSEPSHTAFLRYAEDFFAAYPADVPKFAVHLHGLLSHDNINTIELADADTVAHLRRLRDSGQLNKTLFVMI